MISSTVLALDSYYNWEETENAEIYFICEVQEKVETKYLCEINQILSEKNLGKLLPVYSNEDSVAFTIIPTDFEKSFKLVKRLIWEFGFLLSTEITSVSENGVETIKEYGSE